VEKQVLHIVSVFAALVIQHKKRMRRVTFSSVAVQCFLQYHKWSDFRKKRLLNMEYTRVTKA
jgi:hypothetical protein